MEKIYFCILWVQFIFPSFTLVLQDLSHAKFFIVFGFLLLLGDFCPHPFFSQFIGTAIQDSVLLVRLDFFLGCASFLGFFVSCKPLYWFLRLRFGPLAGSRSWFFFLLEFFVPLVRASFLLRDFEVRAADFVSYLNSLLALFVAFPLPATVVCLTRFLLLLGELAARSDSSAWIHSSRPVLSLHQIWFLCQAPDPILFFWEVFCSAFKGFSHPLVWS
jgi:hypothetical protein